MGALDPCGRRLFARPRALLLVGATSRTATYHRKVATLAFLSPHLQAAILAGKLPDPTLQIPVGSDIPLAWADQEARVAMAR